MLSYHFKNYLVTEGGSYQDKRILSNPSEKNRVSGYGLDSIDSG
jgi:hypothetical protein